MELTCRRQDQGRFEALGFTAQGCDNPASDSATILMVDEEANYAHSGDMHTDIPYHGVHGVGYDYGACAYACDGKTYAEVGRGHAGGFVVDWDETTRRPLPRSLRDVRRYLIVRDKVRAMFKARPTSRPAGHHGSPDRSADRHAPDHQRQGQLNG